MLKPGLWGSFGCPRVAHLKYVCGETHSWGGSRQAFLGGVKCAELAGVGLREWVLCHGHFILLQSTEDKFWFSALHNPILIAVTTGWVISSFTVILFILSILQIPKSFKALPMSQFWNYRATWMATLEILDLSTWVGIIHPMQILASLCRLKQTNHQNNRHEVFIFFLCHFTHSEDFAFDT